MDTERAENTAKTHETRMNADKGGENKKIGSTAETLRTPRKEKNIEDRFARKRNGFYYMRAFFGRRFAG